MQLWGQHCGWAVSLPFAIEERIPRNSRAVLALSDHVGGADLLTLAIRRGWLELSSGCGEVLWRGRAELDDGRHLLHLRLTPHASEIVLNGILLGSAAPVEILFRPRLDFRASARILLSGRPRLQKLADIVFADDFARVGDADELWEVFSGQFELNMNRNPGSSQGAFQFWASCPDGEGLAVAKSSLWFWQDYRFGVSALASENSAVWGLLFNVHSPQDFHLLKIQYRSESALVQLLRRRQAVDVLLEERSIALRPGSWCRAEVFCQGGRIRVCVAGSDLFLISDPHAIGGQSGLYVEKTGQVNFDDVLIRSIRPEALSAPIEAPFGPCEQYWNDFSDKSFRTDDHMAVWAHPGSFWEKSGDGQYWFRNRFFHDVTFRWQPARGRKFPVRWQVSLFAGQDQDQDQDIGYCFKADDGTLTLFRNGQEMEKLLLPLEKTVGELRVQAAKQTLRLWFGEHLLLECVDPEFLSEGEVAADFSASGRNWHHSARVESSHRLDYSFEHAPAAWGVQAGSWQGTHRWACVAKWSFFGGRGAPGPQEVRNGNVVLWNLRQIRGDFDLELFAAPLEGTPQRAHFSWPVSINVAFAADGRSLASGYNLLFGTYDISSRLFYQGRELAVNERMVEADLRNRDMAWYHRMTQTWQHLRIQRRRNRILVDVASHDDTARYQGLQRLFDVPVSADDEGGQFAIWTSGENGLAIARATLAFSESSGAAVRPDPVESSGYREGDGKTAPQRYYRMVNPISGGTFAREIVSDPVDLHMISRLQLNWRASENSRVSLFALIRGQSAELVLQGPVKRRPYTIFLGEGAHQSSSLEGWQFLDIDLAKYLRPFFPEGSLLLEALWLGSPYENYEEIAGFSCNPIGAWYEYGDPIWQAAAEPAAASSGFTLIVAGREFYDDFEGGFGEWRRLGGHDGAALTLDDSVEGGGRCLRLLNQLTGGTAGVWITQRKFSLQQFPALAFSYCMPPGLEQNLLVFADGRKFEIPLTGLDSSWTVLERAAGFVADGHWRHIEIDLAKRFAALFPDGVEISALAFADTDRLGSLQRRAWFVDDFQLLPGLAPGDKLELAVRGKGEITSYQVHWQVPELLLPDQIPVQNGKILTVPNTATSGCFSLRAEFGEGIWSSWRHLLFRAVEARSTPAESPPSTPAVALSLLPPRIQYLPSDCLVSTDFEAVDADAEELRRMGEFMIRREAWVLLHEADAYMGSACARILNLSGVGFFSPYLRKSSWDILRWPNCSFAYRFKKPGCALNLSLLVNGSQILLEWTGTHPSRSRLQNSIFGSIPVAAQDDQWHEVEFSLPELLQGSDFISGGRSVLQGSEFSLWATSHQGYGSYQNPVDAELLIDQFMIYSERGKNPSFIWQQPADSSTATGFSYVWDQNADTVPEKQCNIRETALSFEEVAEGEWYLHLRAVDAENRWSETARKKIRIRK